MRIDTLPSGANLHTTPDMELEEWHVLVPYRLEGDLRSLGPTIDMRAMRDELQALGLEVYDSLEWDGVAGELDEITDDGTLILTVFSATGYNLDVEGVWAAVEVLAAAP